MVQGHPIIKWILAVFLLAQYSARAQGDADAFQLTNDIRYARAQLSARQPPLAPAELDRLADVLGRSNHLARAISEAFARNDETNAARLLGQFTGNVDDLNYYGTPLLIRAIAQNNGVSLVNLLLDRKANPNIASQNGETPLGMALQLRSWTTALRLVTAGADLTPTKGQSPLSMLVEYWMNWSQNDDGRMKLLREMLNRGADPFAPASNDTNHAIIEVGLANMDVGPGELLLTNRPDASRRTPGGNTALHLAVLRGLTNVVDALLAFQPLSNAADNAHTPLKFTVNQTNNDGLTPLQLIAGLAPDQVWTRANFFGFSGLRPRFRFPNPATTMPTNFFMADFLINRGAALDVWSAAGLGRTNELSSMLNGDPALANARDGLGRTPLHYAALTSQFNAARLLIRAGADASTATVRPITGWTFNAQIPAGATPLHLACRQGNAPLVWMLLHAQAAVNQPDGAGDTPLHLAARLPQTNCAAALVQHHAILDTTNSAGRTPLRIAVESAAAANAELFLNAGARPEVGLGSNTLLHLAAGGGSTEMLKVLLGHGFAVDARDGEGNTPFMRAVASRQWPAIVFLLGKGANINAANSRGDTALHLLAVEQQDMVWHPVELSWLEKMKQDWWYHPGFRQSTITNLARWKLIKPPVFHGMTNTSLSQFLLAHHANPNITNHLGQTPLHLLFQSQWLSYQWPQNGLNQPIQRVSALLKAGARVDTPDLQGLTALHVAASNALPAMLSLMAEHAGKLDNLRDNHGRTPLHSAVLSREFAVSNAAILIERGAGVNSRDHEGRTPLHLAVTNRTDQRLQAVTLLLSDHANPNARDTQGCTPLHLLARAIRNNDFFNQANETLEALLKGGADASLLDEEGQTIVHRWCNQGNSHSGNIDGMLRDLLSRHPKFANLTNAAGETPLFTALRSRDTTTVQLLMQHGANPLARNARGESAIYIAQKDERGYLANLVHPVGTMPINFYWSMATRNKQQFDLWLDAEPALANITFNNGETPLMVATRMGLPAGFVSHLMELGATPDMLSDLRLGHMEDLRRLARVATNLPPAFLIEAIRLDRFKDIENLAESRGDLHAVDGEGHSLVCWAVWNGRTNVTDWLRQHGVTQTFFDDVVLGDTNQLANYLATNQSPNGWPQINGQSALMLAARYDQRGSIRVLLAHEAQANAPGMEGMTALHIAAAWGSSRAAEALLLAGADPNVRQSRGFAPLHIAAMNNHAEVARQLLDHGADINARLTNQIDRFMDLPPGATPLHLAAHFGRLEAVRLLLERGADVNATNAAGETPLDLVKVSNETPPYRIILYNGAPGYSSPPQGDKRWTEIESALVQAGGIHNHSALGQ